MLNEYLPPRPSLDQVKEFHEAFGHPIKNKPNIDDENLNRLRVNLIREELSELEEALAASDKIEVLDALLDLQYVLDGAFLALGFHRCKDTAFEEVHASNMSKLGEDGKPIYREDGKILKGPNFFEPDLKKFIDLLDNY